MNLKKNIRRVLQNIALGLPKGFQRYLISCIYEIPEVTIGTGYQITKNLNEGVTETISSSELFMSSNPFFKSIITASGHAPAVDVGANIGQTAAALANSIEDVKFYSLEPFQENFAHLVENTRGLKNISCHMIALSDRNGEVELRRDSHPLSQWNSVSSKYQDLLEQRGSFRMETVTLKTGKSFCESENINRLSLLKIDTEGHEMEVLKGFEPLFLEHRIDSVLVEVGFATNSTHGRFDEIYDFLSNHDFHLYGFFDTDYRPEGGVNFTNAFYVHSRHISDEL